MFPVSFIRRLGACWLMRACWMEKAQPVCFVGSFLQCPISVFVLSQILIERKSAQSEMSLWLHGALAF